MLAKIISNDSPPVELWLTRPDWTSATLLSDALADPPISINGEQMLQQAGGLRADYLLALARGNKSNTLDFYVRESFATSVAAEVAAFTRWTETLPTGGTAYLYLGAPGETASVCEFDDVVIRAFDRSVNGRSLLLGYHLVGGRIFASTDPNATIGIRRNMTTFNFANQLHAGQFGGSATFDVATSILGADLCIDEVADQPVSITLYDGAGVALGLVFALPAGVRLVHISLDTELAITANTTIVPVLSTIGTSAAPGQGLHFILTVRQ
jgi:hypothetical protein